MSGFGVIAYDCFPTVIQALALEHALIQRRHSVGVLKRSHMGQAGRLLIRKQGDVNPLVNWAEGSDSSDDEGSSISTTQC